MSKFLKYLEECKCSGGDDSKCKCKKGEKCDNPNCSCGKAIKESLSDSTADNMDATWKKDSDKDKKKRMKKASACCPDMKDGSKKSKNESRFIQYLDSI